MIPGEFGDITYEKGEGIAYIAFNRPHAKNAKSARLLAEMEYAYHDVMQDEDIKVAILTGTGEYFMNGQGDLEAQRARLDAEPGVPTRVFRYAFNTNASPKAHDVYKPLIVAVNGECATSGMEYLSEGDIIICSDKATFFDNHVSYGALVHSAVALAKRLPYNHVIRMALLGEQEGLDAQRALEIGLVTEVVPHDRLMERATEIAKLIMRNSHIAVQASNEVLWNSLSLGLRDAMQLDSYMQRYFNTHPDLREATKALVENRRPQWK